MQKINLIIRFLFVRPVQPPPSCEAFAPMWWSSPESTSQTPPGALSAQEPLKTGERKVWMRAGESWDFTKQISKMLKLSHLCLSELHSQFLYFLSELPDDTSVGVFIHHSMVDDALSSVCVTQRGQRLLIVVCWRTHGCNHRCAAVAPQTVLDTGERGRERERSRNQMCCVYETMWKMHNRMYFLSVVDMQVYCSCTFSSHVRTESL